MLSGNYTMFLLGTEEKNFAIYTEKKVGENIQNQLAQTPKKRPLTHDLIQNIFKGLDVRVLQVVITDVEDTVYFAKLFIEQTIGEQKTIVDIDARPSDALTIALTSDIPIYCTQEMLSKVVSVDH